MDELISRFIGHSTEYEPERQEKERAVAESAERRRFYEKEVTKRQNELTRSIYLLQLKVHERTHASNPLATEATELERMLENRYDEVEALYNDHMKDLDSDTVLGRYGAIEEELRPLQEHFDKLKKQSL